MMVGTRLRKILRDVWTRKVRTLLVSASIFIGVFGVVTLYSAGELLIDQLEKDIQQDRLAMIRTVLTVSRGAEVDNTAALNTLRDLPGVTVAEGRAVYPLLWKLPDEDRFRDGTIAAYSAPFGAIQLEPPRLYQGAYPAEGGQQIAIERRMAERWGLAVGDAIDVRILSRAKNGNGAETSERYTISGLLFQAYGEQAGPGFAGFDTLVFATYEDAQHIAGFTGLSHIYTRFIDFATAEEEAANLQATIANQTPYVPVFTNVEDPAASPLIEQTRQTNQILVILAMVALVVSGFLVINVVNSIVVEQRKQIGVMKSLGATRADNFGIYSGIAFLYGLIGVIPGVLLGIPGAYGMAQALAQQSNTIIEEFGISLTGIVLGILVGLAVPFLAAVVPVINGTRVSILQAMTDLGIESNYGKGPVARLIAMVPLSLTIKQAVHNVNQKKFRLALTGTTLTVAIGAFMGIFAVFASLGDVIEDVFSAFGSQMSIEPNEGQPFDTIQTLVMTDEFQARLAEKGLPAIQAIEPGAQLAIEIEGYDPPPVQGGPPGIAAQGINTYNPDLISFSLNSGTDWRDDPTLDGVVISSRIAEIMGKDAGDSIVIMAGGNRDTFEILGVASFPFDWVWMRYETLARLGGLVLNGSRDAANSPAGGPAVLDSRAGEGDIYANSISVILASDDPTEEQVDAVIEELNNLMLANGITAEFTNWIAFQNLITQIVQVFNIILYLAAALIAAVGAIGLLTSLSMSVFERQKEIGVMRSVGATSGTIALQFLIEGLVIGVAAWAFGVPLGYVLSRGLARALPFENFGLGFPPQTVVFGLAGMLIVTTVASLWPSLSAARRTVSDILRYQ